MGIITFLPCKPLGLAEHNTYVLPRHVRSEAAWSGLISIAVSLSQSLLSGYTSLCRHTVLQLGIRLFASPVRKPVWVEQLLDWRRGRLFTILNTGENHDTEVRTQLLIQHLALITPFSPFKVQIE